MKVLVTGAGSLIGHGILRCLAMIKDRQIEIYTADPDHRAAGHWLGHHAIIIPMAKDPSYIDQLSSVITKNNIDVLFIGTDPELMKIAESRSQLKCTVIVSAPNVIHIGEDKWETVRFLKSHNFPFPDTALAEDKSAVADLVARVGL